MNNAEGRLEKLEKELRKTRRLALVLAAGLATAALVTAARDRDVVMAKRFALVDDAGRTRGRLTMEETGPALGLFDENGEVRAGLAVGAGDMPALWLYDENGESRAGLAVLETGPGLWLYYENGEVGAKLDVSTVPASTNTLPALRLYDENGKIRALLSLVEGAPGLDLYDENGRLRGTLAVVKKAGPGLVLYDVRGTPFWGTARGR